MSGLYPERIDHSEAALLFAVLPSFEIPSYSVLNIITIIIIRALRHDTHLRIHKYFTNEYCNV
jgi:hypothetical protein